MQNSNLNASVGQPWQGAGLQVMVEGKSYDWADQYITGSQLKKIAGLRSEVELFIAIAFPWKDEAIENDDRIDLARPGIEQFFVHKKLPYTIGEKTFESASQWIRGSRIREQGVISEGFDIYLRVQGPWEDELISDEDWVDLARPGIEHFYAKQTVTEVIIIVNGRACDWSKKTISFEEVVRFAHNIGTPGEEITYTVTYKNGPKENPLGSLVKGKSVFVKQKMIFNATCTNRS